MCCHSLWHRTAERFENDLDDDQEHNIYLAHMKKWACRAPNFLLEALCKCYHTSSFRLQLGSALFHSRYVQGSRKGLGGFLLILDLIAIMICGQLNLVVLHHWLSYNVLNHFASGSHQRSDSMGYKDET